MSIVEEIKADPANAAFTKAGWTPVLHCPSTAKILIIGQAPGWRVQESGQMWADASGDRLRTWLGVDRATFYDSGAFALLPMDFYYPGKAKSGDVGPRRGIAERWHPKILATMPDLELIILVGSYAQHYYLHEKASATLTETVAHYQDYLPKYWPLVHPSARNNIWLSKNAWFESQVLPALQKKVATILQQ
ncbi:uracil-DNA glycosylase family protein [Leuconostocaceae bacterium ESL0958]|nr:uracil-DNA glycosylase family protein [Leuconostocaceae bacterium ESL0958]